MSMDEYVATVDYLIDECANDLTDLILDEQFDGNQKKRLAKLVDEAMRLTAWRRRDDRSLS